MSAPIPPAGVAPAPGGGPPAPPSVSTARLVAVLAGGGAFAGLLLVVAFLATRDAIAAHKAQVLEEGILEVLGAPPRYETLWAREGSLVAEAPADPARAERIWRGVREDGSTSGWAIQAKGVGFADDIRLLFGYDATSGRVLGFRVLELKETPGLGDGIAKDLSFTTGLTGARVPLTGIKPGVARDADAGKVHTITGATISSRAVLRIVNGAVARWAPRIEAWGGKAPR